MGRPPSGVTTVSIVILAMVVHGPVSGSPTAVSKEHPTCFGEAATVVGTNRSDHLRGTPGTDVIVGLGGADYIKSFAGNDLVCAGPGPHANGYMETIQLGPGADRFRGGPGKDFVRGAGGGDLLYGGKGNDWLTAMSGPDELWGGSRHDIFEPGPGADQIYGGRWRDTVFFEDAQRPLHVDLRTGRARGEGRDSLTGIENVHGVFGWPNQLIGDSGPNWLFGGAGAEVLRGLGGDDHLLGDGGRDRLRGGAGFDYAVVSNDIYRIHVDLADGTFRELDSTYRLFGIEGVVGGNARDHIRGDDGDNVLLGGRGTDWLRGRAGDDVIKGGVGRDDLYGGRGVDRCRSGATTHACE
jgi:Ca2+-binding RTX toxin-like protein